MSRAVLTFQQMLSIRHAPPHLSHFVQALTIGILLAPNIPIGGPISLQ
jgi:hypothetical protein